MSKTVLHGALMACGFAMLMFVAGYAGWQLGLVWLAGALYPLASKIILSAFALLCLSGGSLLIWTFCQSMLLYFRREAMVMRRIKMLQVRQHDVRQRYMLEKRQLHYLSHIKRQRLLAVNDKRHVHDLLKIIRSELKHYAIPLAYKKLCGALKQHYKKYNFEVMLVLRDQALCR